MKNLKLLALLFFSFALSNINAQKVKKVTKEYADNSRATYYVLKRDKSIKHGSYLLSKKIGSQKYVIKSGNYILNKKEGVWEIYNISSRHLMYREYYQNNLIIKKIGVEALDTTTYIYQKDSLIFQIYKNSNQDNLKFLPEKNDTQFIYYNDANETFRGILVHKKKEGIWNLKLDENTFYSCNFNNDKQIYNNTSYYANKDTLAHSYTSNNLTHFTVYNPNKKIATYWEFDNTNNTNSTFTTFYPNGKICQKGCIYNNKIAELQSYDSSEILLPFGQVNKGNGNYAIISILENKLKIIDSCNIKDSLLNGYRKCDNSRNGGYYANNFINESYNGIISRKQFIPNNKNFNNFIYENSFKLNTAYLDLDEIYELIVSNFKIPKIAQESSISGIIYIDVYYNNFGKAIAFKPNYFKYKKLGHGLEEECIRVLEIYKGNWPTITTYGAVCEKYYTIPFQVDNSGF